MTLHVAAAILLEGNRVLLGHRHPARLHYPNVWDLPGGHIEPGETAAAAITRELAEELGVDISEAVPQPWRRVQVGDIDITVFIVRAWKGTVRNAQPDEHDALRWFGSEEIDGIDLADSQYRELLRAALAEPRVSHS